MSDEIDFCRSFFQSLYFMLLNCEGIFKVSIRMEMFCLYLEINFGNCV